LESRIKLRVTLGSPNPFQEASRQERVASDVYSIASGEQHMIDEPLGGVAQFESHVLACR
jgi:hypothetical protein